MERHVSSLSGDPLDRPLKGVGRIDLWHTFNLVLRRLAEKLVVGEIHDEQITVADQMEWILGRIQTDKSFVFSQLFPEGTTLRKLVATFLAVLELTRLGRLKLQQDANYADIVCHAVPEIPLETPPVESTVVA
jgi:segregation and condensation protein A